jgi:hypothetical protein
MLLTARHGAGRVPGRAWLTVAPASTLTSARPDLMMVLPFGAKHPDALANLEGLVAHRLEHPSNAKLRRRLQKEFEGSGGTSIGVDST